MTELTGYNEFILEKQIAQLIMESQIVYSRKFLDLLNSVGRNEIVTKLLSLQSQDVDIQQNYIDAGSAKDTVTFTPERKVRELLGNRQISYVRVGEGGLLGLTVSERDPSLLKNRSVFARLGYETEGLTDATRYKPQDNAVGRILATTQGRKEPIQTYVLFECTDGPDAGKKCVINRTRLQERDETTARMWVSQRSSIKIGRLTRALLTLVGATFTDAQIEEFVNRYKSCYDVMNDAFARFDVVSGDQIAHWYNYRNYQHENNGVLGSSCMKNAPATWLRVYTRNPEQCKLVILYSSAGQIREGKFTSNKICGRAILWKTDEGDTFMERIYTNDDSDVDLYKRYCYHNGWWCRTRQEYGFNFEVENGNTSKRASYIVTLAHADFDSYPFVDSLCFLNTRTKRISNIKANVDANRRIQSTGGGYATE